MKALKRGANTTVIMVVFFLLALLTRPVEGFGKVIRIDGSSTVYPIAEAMAEEFQKIKKGGIRITVGISGTGGGFRKLIRGEIDIATASRPITASEVEAARAAGIDFIEMPIAYDGIAITVNPRNTWITSMTVTDLRKIWQPEATKKITRWNQVNPAWPDAPLNLYGPGVDSGTFDYFTEAIVGKAKASRSDFTSSEDDNILVQGIATDRNALGYFGYAYYIENKDKLKLVSVDNGKGPVFPSEKTIMDGTYRPLSRPAFIYVAKKSSARPEVREFIEFFLSNAPELVGQAKHIPLPDRAYKLVRERFTRGLTGSIFDGTGKVGMTILDILKLGELKK